MEVREAITDAIMQNIGTLKGTPSGWQKRNCMMCHHLGHGADKRERFGILFTQDGGMNVNCFNCGFSTGWHPQSQLGEKMMQFLQTIGVPEEDVKRLKFEAFREATNQRVNDFRLKGSVTAKWKEIEFLKDCHPIRHWLDQNCQDRNFLRVIEYADERGILDIDKMYWTPCKDDRERIYNRRIVVPYFYKGKIVGFTGRIAAHNPPKTTPKYMQEMPLSFIYGTDHQQDFNRKFIIITEGIFDALVTDGIATLHNNINEDQAAIINSLPGQKILCPDRDKDGDDLVEIAIKHRWAVAFPNWGRNDHGKPVKDAGEAAELYGDLLTIKSIIDSRETVAQDIRIKRKMDRIDYGY